MPDPIPESEIAEGLAVARSLGIISSWQMKREDPGARWFHVTFADGVVVRYTPAVADAFSLGVKLTAARALEILKGVSV